MRVRLMDYEGPVSPMSPMGPMSLMGPIRRIRIAGPAGQPGGRAAGQRANKKTAGGLTPAAVGCTCGQSSAEQLRNDSTVTHDHHRTTGRGVIFVGVIDTHRMIEAGGYIVR